MHDVSGSTLADRAMRSFAVYDDDVARQYLERLRWPHFRECSRCDCVSGYATGRVGRYRCENPRCRKDFTVMTGTILEGSHLPPLKWLIAFWIIAGNGASAHQLADELGVPYKTAWHTRRRILAAMETAGIEPVLVRPGRPSHLADPRDPRAKLTAEERAALRYEVRIMGRRVGDVAKRYGISQSHASRLAASEQTPTKRPTQSETDFQKARSDV